MVDDLYDRPLNAFVAGFIGESNLLPVRVLSTSGGQASVDVEAFRRTIAVDAAPGTATGEPARLLIRPEHIELGLGGDGVAAEIVEVIYLGELTQLTLRLDGGETLAARKITDRTLRAGARVHVSWKPGHARAVPHSPSKPTKTEKADA
ncbi:TOBE domain-containing protein [Mesorhizobium sp. BH1-1-4]|uniref:TOBE domain-containing protein n=1 Tax=Mesorhizobium sp. BH1-1-4 TaxID=2876662 RepID=UPI00398CCC2E